MKFEIRQRDRRALILLVLAVAIYGVAKWVILPAYDRLTAAQERAADKEKQLRRYRRAELRKGQYTDLLKVADARVKQSESVVIATGNLSLASAELQSMVEGTANKVGVMLGQRMIGTPRRLNDYFAEVPMTMSFESTPGQVVAFLNELRSLPRFVTVRALQVTPVSPVFEAPKGSDLTKNVRVSITCSALTSADLMKAEAPKK
jgi:Tfp pilus assembly protein PilO